MIDINANNTYRHGLLYKQPLGEYNAAFLCYFFDKICATGSKIFIMYFFALISNPQSELENFRRVFFYSHFNF